MKNVALCFLISNPDGRLHQSDQWYKYTSNPLFLQYGRIYVHSKYPVKDPFLLQHSRIVEHPILNTYWGNISLVEATLHMLKFALQDDPDISYFMLVSESCIPIVEFQSFYSFLESQESPRSIFNGSKCCPEFYYRFEKMLLLADGSRYIEWEEFMIASQWMLLLRDDAQFLVDTRSDTKYFQYMTAPDEHYFINALHKHKKEFIFRELTFTQWRDGQAHPDTFSAITSDVVQKARSRGAFFLRKINSATQILHEF